jgi:hypothetical protein
MLTPDEITPTTGELESIVRVTDRRSALRLKRQQLRHQPTTDALPNLHVETPPPRIAPRQLTQTREENRHLRMMLETVREELYQARQEYALLQARYEHDVAVIHSAHQQEMDAHEQQLQEVLEAHTGLQREHQSLAARFQELQQALDASAAQLAQEKIAQVTQELEVAPETTPPLLEGVLETLQRHAKEREDKNLVEILFLKREIQRMNERLEHERQQVDTERQKLLALQNSAREQAELREQMVEARFQARWRMRAIVSSIGMLLLLVALQFCGLHLLHADTSPLLSLALIAPIIICVVCAIVFATPVSMVKIIYHGAPHKRRVKA